jgi:hypothetical protein
MNDLQRFELQDQLAKSRLPLAQNGRKIAISLLAGLISSVMIVWFVFLGWGFVAIFQWLLKIS